MTMLLCMDQGWKQGRFVAIFVTLSNLIRNAPASIPPIIRNPLSFRMEPPTGGGMRNLLFIVTQIEAVPKVF